eukprot:9486220-Pyramimonas_sp.AAC.2
MDKLGGFTKARADNINRYVENLKRAGTSFVLPIGHEKYDWLALPLMHPRRMELLKYLEENEVQRNELEDCTYLRAQKNARSFTCTATALKPTPDVCTPLTRLTTGMIVEEHRTLLQRPSRRKAGAPTAGDSPTAAPP